MNMRDVLDRAQDLVSVRTVFGEPVERDGVVVIPAATVGLGGGGGGGQDQEGNGGEGVGYGGGGKAVGAFVVTEGNVEWRPAVDVNRLASSFAVVASIYLFTKWRIEVARAKARTRNATL